MEKYLEQPGKALQKINIVVVPGIAGQGLGEQTCLHFVPWFKEFFKRQVQMYEDTHITAWMFKHGLHTNSLDSLEHYGFAGHKLLHSLNDMSTKGLHNTEDRLLLIGHKLGGFIIKQAIIDANNKVHLYQERTLLETIELLMMLGDPHFDDDNQLDWNRLIASCLPNAKNHYLEDSVQVLRTISRKFEDLTVFSSLFQVSGSLPNGRKGLRFRKKSKLGGCLCDATVSVRLFTTQAEDADIPGLPGNGKVCAFCPTSSHHITLLEAGDEKNILAIQADTSPLLLDVSAQQSSPITEEYQRAQVSSAEALTSDDTLGLCKDEAFSMTEAKSTSLQTPDDSKPLAHPQCPIRNDNFEGQTPSTSADSSFSPASEVDPSKKPTDDACDKPDEFHSGPMPAPGFNQELFNGSEPPTSCIDDSECHSSLSTSRGLHNASETHFQNHPVKSEPANLPCYFRVPDRAPQFFGRHEILRKLETVFDQRIESLDTAISKAEAPVPVQVVLWGPGGIGKTSTVVEYASQHVQEFDAILWINAHTTSRLAQSYQDVAVALGLSKARGLVPRDRARQIVQHWLNTTKSRVLLVLDSLDDIKDDVENLREYLPQNFRTSVVITSRYPLRRLEDSSLHMIEVGPLSVEEATAYLASMAPETSENADPQALEVLVEKFGCLPLALTQAASFVRRTGRSYESCLQIIADRRLSPEIYIPLPLLRSFRGLTWRNSDQSVYHELPSWTPAWTSVTLSHEALATINVCAFYDADEIKVSILLGAVEGGEVALHKFPRTQRGCSGVRSELWDAALCTFDDSGRGLKIHESVQESVRASLAPEQFQESFHTACDLLLRQWPSSRKLRNLMNGHWREFDSLLPHVTSLFRIYQETLDEPNRVLDRHSAGNCRPPNQTVSSKPLLNDSFCRIVVMSSWYNAHRGHESEERPLTEFARKLVLASSPGIPQTLEPDSDSDTSPIISSYVIDNLDDILFPALSTDKPAPRQQEAITKPNQCSETDIFHADQALREGERLAASQQYLDAIGYIVMARDIVSAFKQISVEAIDLYSRASFYLGLVYSRCGKLEIAELSISRAEIQLRYHTEIKIETTSQHLGRFTLALGIIKANSPEHVEETIHLLERARLLFAQDLADNESENDWTAITSLKLADQFLACKQFQEAHNHLQKTIEHFQPQSTLSAQAQTCRALHRKALIHEAEGKNFERSMFMGAAKETWKHVRSAQQTADQSLTDDATLRREDFDNAIPEFWLR